jgi:Cu-processing system ATP-binding protein
LIRLEGAAKSFGERLALAPIDLEVRKGEKLGVFGRNGSGKTTLLRILVGLSRPSAGQLSIDGEPPGPQGWQAFRHRLGFMPEKVFFEEGLSGAYLLDYLARLRGADPGKVLEMLERVGLGEAAHDKVGTYSKGMVQRLNLAQALIGDPEVLVVDEPMEGLDPHGSRLFLDLLESHEERTVVFSSHRLSRFAGLVDRIAILSNGELAALGTEEEVRHRFALPCKIIIQPHPEAAQEVEAFLAAQGLAAAARSNGRVTIRVSQADKVAFLAELGSLADAIRHATVEEPTLEEILIEAD